MGILTRIIICSDEASHSEARSSTSAVSPSGRTARHGTPAPPAGLPTVLRRPSEAFRSPTPRPVTDETAHEHPAANLFRKHEKSSTLSTGGVVELSQLAY